MYVTCVMRFVGVLYEDVSIVREQQSLEFVYLMKWL